MPLNRLRVSSSKFFTMTASLNRKSSIFSLFFKIIAIFILKSAMIVLSFVMSHATGFVVHFIARSIRQCVARQFQFLGAQSPSRRSIRVIASGVISPYIYNPHYFG